MEAALVARDVRKSYGDTVALDGATLSIDDGEVVVLVGPNGAGKTTFVRALTGTTTPDSGTLALYGESPADLDRDRLGVLPQSFAPPERLTAAELLEYYAGLYDDANDPEQVLVDVGLSDCSDTWYEQLSGGQRRRACLGAAIVNEPDIVILDEPTTGIDPAGRRTVRKQIDRLASTGSTVLVTTHDMAEAATIADRVALLVDGQIKAVDEPERLIEEYGGEPQLEIGVSTPEEAINTIEAGEWASTDTNIEVDRTDGTVTVAGVKPTDIGAIAAALDDAGVEYDALRWRQPDLESVYMALAGASESVPDGHERRHSRREREATPESTSGGERP